MHANDLPYGIWHAIRSVFIGDTGMVNVLIEKNIIVELIEIELGNRLA